MWEKSLNKQLKILKTMSNKWIWKQKIYYISEQRDHKIDSVVHFHLYKIVVWHNNDGHCCIFSPIFNNMIIREFDGILKMLQFITVSLGHKNPLDLNTNRNLLHRNNDARHLNEKKTEFIWKTIRWVKQKVFSLLLSITARVQLNEFHRWSLLVFVMRIHWI